MKKVILSAAVLAASLGPALAADLPVLKAPPVVLPPPPLWTGFYVGLNAGGTFGDSDSTTVSTGAIFANPAVPLNTVWTAAAASAGGSGVFGGNGVGGFIGGGQIGYNYQFYNSFVAGVEADIQGVAGTNQSLSATTAVGEPNFPGAYVATGLSITRSLDYLGTVRGRIGYLVTPTLLVYGTGGLAYGGVNSSTSIIQALAGAGVATINAPYFGGGSYSSTQVGWTAGGGVEWLFLPNWSAKVEYLYYDLGSVTYSNGILADIVVPPGGTVPTGGVWHALASQTSTRFNGNIVRAGVNYHFNWAAPVPIIAKY